MSWQILIYIVLAASLVYGIYWYFNLKPNPLIPFINDDKIFFIGMPGQGKTKLFKKLSGNQEGQNSKIQPFTHWKLETTNFSLVDTPSIEFDDSIDKREEIIELFQIHFKEISYRVSLFLIFVKFERTDIMKKNIMSVYRFLNKFQNIIRIVVTDFHLSESKTDDQKQLQEAFKVFVNDKEKHILFFGNDTTTQEINRQLYDMVSDIHQTEPINLSNTIFEEISEEEQKKIMGNIYNIIPQDDKL